MYSDPVLCFRVYNTLSANYGYNTSNKEWKRAGVYSMSKSSGGGGFEKSPNERSTVLISVVATLREEYIFLRDAAPRLREG